VRGSARAPLGAQDEAQRSHTASGVFAGFRLPWARGAQGAQTGLDVMAVLIVQVPLMDLIVPMGMAVFRASTSGRRLG
jgi:hypothetical protein